MRYLLALLLLALPFAVPAQVLQPGATDRIFQMPNGDSWALIEGEWGCECGWLALRRAGEANWLGDRSFDVYGPRIDAAGGPEAYVRTVLLPMFSARLQELYGATVPPDTIPPADVVAVVWQILRQRVRLNSDTFTFSLS